MKIGNAIRQLRVNKTKQSQSLFAKNTGITQSYLSQIENNKKVASTQLLEKIANHLEIPLSIIFWFSIEKEDVKKEKQEYFDILKPGIDGLISCLF